MSEATETQLETAESALAQVKNRGIVYVLTNDAMPDYVKIGETSG